MRALCLLLAVTGCGRVAFEPRSDAAAPDAFVCPAGYTFDEGSCYRGSPSNATWLAAEAACEADAVGAHLAVIDSAAEATVAARYQPSPTDFAWIGGTDQVTEATYVTVTNRPLPYLVFATQEPEGALEDCLLLREANTIGDGDCANPDDYICEYDGVPAVTLAWGACPAGYTLAGGGCYRGVVASSGVQTTWLDAEAACEADGVGRHLVVLDTLAEAMTIDSFVTVLDHWVGLSDLATEAVFRTVTDVPAGFMTWQIGEPNGGTTQNCVIFSDAVELDTKDCAAGDDYVCEYDGIAAVPAAWGQ